MTSQHSPGLPFRPRPGGGLTSGPIPVATLWLIAITGLAHLVRTMMPSGTQVHMIIGLAMSPDVVLGGATIPGAWVPAWLTPVTALFLHANFMHLFNNMLWLLIFGGLAERVLGRVRLLLLYLAAGSLGNLAEAGWAVGTQTLVIGASGAASGLVGAHLMLCLIAARAGGPGSAVLLRQAGVLAAVWALVQVLTVGTSPLNIAWVAHVGGLLAGFLLVTVLLPQRLITAARPSRRPAVGSGAAAATTVMPVRHRDTAPPRISPGSASPDGTGPDSVTPDSAPSDNSGPASPGDAAGPPGAAGSGPSRPPGRRLRRSRIPTSN